MGKPDYNAAANFFPSNRDLVVRVLHNLRPRRRCPMWAEVTRVFACGSTIANALCRLHSFDPDQIISSQKFPKRSDT